MGGTETRPNYPSAESRVKAEKPTWRQVGMRGFLDVVARPIFRQKTEFVLDGEGRNGLERAIEEARENNRGTLIIWNHAAERDGFDIAKRFVVEALEFIRRISVFPVAQHQEKPPLGWLQKHAAFLYPFITTEDTFAKVRNMVSKSEYIKLNKDNTMEKVVDDGTQYLSLKDGLTDYIRVARDAISQGGTVSVAFQGGRRDHLDMKDKSNSIGTILSALKRKGTTNVGILLVGLSEDGREDYDLADGGIRPGKKAKITVGPYYTFEELLAHPQIKTSENDSANLRESVDRLVREIFHEKLIVPEYSLPPRPEAIDRHRRKRERRKTTRVISAIRKSGKRS